MKLKGLLLLTLLIGSIAVVALPSPEPVAAHQQEEQYDRRAHSRCMPVGPKIEFVKWERSENGVRFYYKMTAGSRDITQWSFTSPVFRKATLLGTSETSYVYYQELCTIIFKKPIMAGQSRVMWFDLKIDYQGMRLGPIYYTIKANIVYTGWVRGPVFTC